MLGSTCRAPWCTLCCWAPTCCTAWLHCQVTAPSHFSWAQCKLQGAVLRDGRLSLSGQPMPPIAQYRNCNSGAPTKIGELKKYKDSNTNTNPNTNKESATPPTFGWEKRKLCKREVAKVSGCTGWWARRMVGRAEYLGLLVLFSLWWRWCWYIYYDEVSVCLSRKIITSSLESPVTTCNHP